MTVWAAVAAFGAGAVFDMLNVRFIRSSTAGRPALAANYSAAVGAAGLTGMVASVQDIAVAPFLLAGYWVGTYIAVRFTR